MFGPDLRYRRFHVRGPVARVGHKTLVHLNAGTLVDWQNCWECVGCEGQAPALSTWLLDMLASVVNGGTRIEGTDLSRAFTEACRRVERP